MRYSQGKVYKQGSVHTVEYIMGECPYDRTYMRRSVHTIEGKHYEGYTQ